MIARDRRDDAPALIFRGEDGERRSMSFADLHAAVSRLAATLEAWGIAPGDLDRAHVL